MPTSHEHCSLSPTAAASQALEWREMQRRARSRRRIPGGVALTFEIALAARLEDLARREATCCGFLSINTARLGDEIRVEITSRRPDAAPVVEFLAGWPA